MFRNTQAIGLVLAAMLASSGLAGTALAQGPRAATDFRPATAEDLARTIVPGETPAPGAGLSSAAGLRAAARCDQETPRASIVSLAWTPANGEAVSGQRVEISKFHEGFERGPFETTGTLSPQTATVAVNAPEPGIRYYWRVLTARGDGWRASTVERFEAPVCPSDPPRVPGLGQGGR